MLKVSQLEELYESQPLWQKLNIFMYLEELYDYENN